ncbi:NAD(P)/FAD-dependent oxidoreductase [Luteimonas sp. R10]|uniref:NAD(P)/FAD-dependent oxidoreductase n=1 Tax=Luteimonas sp. R10 TaxID=3108176 RepID=UPI0030888BD6|nr:NAD(P)/FAD-dependent oxidoreductase [Luteimonas sp. R10]
MSGNFDCAIVGAGPAGLAAALYLERFHRRVVLLDDGRSRMRWIGRSRNLPGYPHGISGPALLDRLRRQLRRYGTERRNAAVDAIDGQAGAFLLRVEGGERIAASRVILATGTQDTLPRIRGLEEALQRGLLRICPVCDGYEATDRRLAVLGPVGEASRHACFLRTFSDRVAVLPTDGGDAGPDATGILPRPAWLRARSRSIEVAFDDRASVRFDALYLSLGAKPRASLAASLGAPLAEDGTLRVNAHQQTGVDGLYAIGDVAHDLNQVAVALGHAAIAATAVHNALPEHPRRA